MWFKIVNKCPINTVRSQNESKRNLQSLQGQQVRDIKNSQRYGTSLIFENTANLQSSEHWQKILQGFQEDFITYYSENLAFGPDTFNLVIADSSKTPNHDRKALGLFTEREQKIRFCFYDFSSKYAEYKEVKYAFLNSTGNIERTLIEREVEFLFNRAISTLSTGLLPIEYVNILGGVHTLVLASEGTCIQKLPERTIALKKMEDGNHFGYYMDQHEQLKEVEIGEMNFDDLGLYIVLRKLAEKFPSPGEMTKKITINDHEEIIQKIADKLRCKQYFRQSCALDIHELAKNTIAIIKPTFIKAVTDEVMKKLEKLSPEEREKKFKVYEELNHNRLGCATQ